MLGLEVEYPGAFATSSAQFEIIEEASSQWARIAVLAAAVAAIASAAAIFLIRYKNQQKERHKVLVKVIKLSLKS